MAIEERTRAYETLIRHNDDRTIGAHHQTISEVLRDGIVIAATVNPPIQVEGSGLEDVLGVSLAIALVQIQQMATANEQAKARIAELEAYIAATSEPEPE